MVQLILLAEKVLMQAFLSKYAQENIKEENLKHPTIILLLMKQVEEEKPHTYGHREQQLMP